MTIKQLVVGPLQTNCYILQSGKKGIVIDPAAEPKKIIAAIAGLDILLILITHRHFDHVEALRDVKQHTHAKAAIHPLDWIDGCDIKLADDQKIEFDKEEITVLHTPGHTPGGCCFLIGHDLFSGDTLFPNGPGNTSFPGGDEQAIFRSIREKLLVLPDETIVYPGHGPSTTIGSERGLY
jgi:hydroxyacylglutathione hydrolase